MHRFRKKSDAKRGEGPSPSPAGYHPAFSPAGPSTSANANSSSAQYQPYGSQHARPYPSPIVTTHIVQHPPPEPPSLPPISDFRTSLILPDLSKRFTLLRSNNGNALNIDDLRNRFAEQRAKGAENQISEEEEAMLLDMLSRMRAQGAKFSKGGQNTMRSEPSQQSLSSNEGGDGTSSASSTVRQSGQSTTTLASPINGYDQNFISASFSPTSTRSKRHSNQLFSGSQLRDLRTMRKTSNRTISSNRSVLSAAPSEVPSSIATSGSVANALIDFYSENGARPTTPENNSPPASVTSSPVSPPRISSISSVEDVLAPLPSASHLRVKKEFTSNQLQRISMCLDDALKELEEEAEDQVLVPRTSQLNGAGSAGAEKNAFALTTDDRIVSPVAVNPSSSMSFTATTMTDVERPASAGGYRSPSPYRAGGAASPVPRVPGYIPGMPRPVTPHRDTDNIEEVRSLSITPRAASSSISSLSISSPIPNLLRQAVGNSPTPYGSRPKSPHSSVRQGGRATPDERSSFSGSTGSPTDHPPLSSHWRRPSSPLSTNSNAFQSLNGGSRPSTPSNVTWTMPGRTSTSGSQPTPLQGVVRPLARNGTLSGHSRNGSVSSIGENEWKEKESRVELGTSPNTSSSNLVLKSPKPVYKTAEEEETRPKFLSNGSSLSTSALAFIEFDPTIGTNPLPLSPTPPVHRTKSPAIFEDTISGRQKKSVASQLLTPPTSPFANKFGNDSNPLLLSSSISNNSSRSSLVSVGSSYHSWEEENGAGGLFVPLPGGQEVAWHDIPSSSNLSSNSRSHSRHSSKDEPESILRQHTGLSKADLLAIQGKLVDASLARAKTADVRASSTLRRRRPSTAHSIQSTGPPSRTTSPAPRIGAQWAATVDNTVKANALLDSVIDSLRFPEDEAAKYLELETPLQPPVIPALTPLSTSSPGRRNKDLADILFGANGEDRDPLPSVIDSEPSPLGEGIPFYNYEKQASESGHEPRPSSQLQVDEPELSPIQVSEDHNGPVIPNFKHEDDQAELMRQVQERTQAAMAQLRKSPQQNRFPSLQPPGPRKKILLQDISGPHLIQSSTSVDKLPNVSVSPRAHLQPEGPRTVKFSLTKRLRNTLKSKPGPLSPSGEEVTPWMHDNNSTTFPSSPQNSHTSLGPPKTNLHSSGSVSDHGSQYKGSNVSPPASAGPNLKTFMSRFRKKGQEPPAQKNFSMPPPSNTGSRRSFQLHPASAIMRSGSVSQAGEQRPVIAPAMSRDVTERPGTGPMPTHHPAQPSDPNALKQFYEAAQNLGLDQGAINDFLTRSGSLTSKPPVKRVEPPVYDDELVEERVHSPVIPEVFIDRQGVTDISRNNTLRQSTSSNSPMSAVPRRVREVSADSNARNTILRRTLIFPSAPNANGSSAELHMPTKKTAKSVKRASALSFQSNRSLIDRVPTPPPSKAKRQSVEPSPPMPNFPNSPSWVSLGRPSMSRSPAPSPNDYSRYESFYEMYTGDQSGSTELDHPKTPEDGMPEVEDGQALEVIELANGETIWSIVNGLRADDTESFYQRRGSFESEFSVGEPGDGENEQLFFKEHVRSGSKSSSTSNPRRRSHLTANRPETKIFYSSSTHIARLIENLSRNTEAATFNIKPKDMPNLGPDFGTHLPPHIPGHSHSSSLQTDSDIGFTVEERLDRMIDRVNSDQ